MAYIPADLLLPPGIIFPFWGTKNDIPKGWKLCDGTNDTPDLRGKFMRGTGEPDVIGLEGGFLHHMHDVTGVARIPSAFETSEPFEDVVSPGNGDLTRDMGNRNYKYHKHSFNLPNLTVTGSAEASPSLPPYTEVNFIMRVNPKD